ncbi:hypothetical protein MRX96_044023 [Rhipicephalus microplus]
MFTAEPLCLVVDKESKHIRSECTTANQDRFFSGKIEGRAIASSSKDRCVRQQHQLNGAKTKRRRHVRKEGRRERKRPACIHIRFFFSKRERGGLEARADLPSGGRRQRSALLVPLLTLNLA